MSPALCLLLCVALASGAPNLLPGDPRLEHADHHHDHHQHDHHQPSEAEPAAGGAAGAAPAENAAAEPATDGAAGAAPAESAAAEPAPPQDPAPGVPDLSIGSNNIDYGAGIQVTPLRPGQQGHHNPFNPDYQPPAELSQASELFGGRPTATQKPFPQPSFTQETTRRPVFTQQTTTRRPFFTQRTTTRRPFFTQRTTTRRPFPQQPAGGQQNRPSNLFLGEASVPAPPPPGGNRPVTSRPIAPQEVNTNPLGGPSGPKGPLVATCPGPASALRCVPENECDPYSGYLISDNYQLPYPITANTPTVAVTQCQLGGGDIGVCCRKFPRLRPTTTRPPARPTVDYGQGLTFVTQRPGQQRPSNIFLPSYKAAPKLR